MLKMTVEIEIGESDYDVLDASGLTEDAYIRVVQFAGQFDGGLIDVGVDEVDD